jgi:hydrogenase expression/formation protein HypE
MKTLPLGKVPWDILTYIVQKQGFIPKTGIIQTSEPGVDVAVLDLKEIITQVNKTYQTQSFPYLVYKADPITFPTPDPANYLIIVNKNDLATAGAIPYGITSTILMPPSSTKSDLIEIQNNLSKICAKERISILGGHTEITTGVVNPILSASMIGFVPPEYYIPRKPELGDSIICSGWIGAEGTGILLAEAEEFFMDNLTSREFQDGITIGKKLDISKQVIECNKRWHNMLHLVHDATEGGILGAIYECLTPKGFGCDINLEKIPIKQVTKKIAEILELNPYKLISSGAVIFICKSDSAANIVKFLTKNGYPASIVGKVTSKRSEIIVNGDISGPPKADHLIKGLEHLDKLRK